MINVRNLKLKKIFKLKEYLAEKIRLDREYKEYVRQAIREAEEDFREGRFYTEEEFLIEIAKDIQEFEMMRDSEQEKLSKSIALKKEVC